MLKIKCQFIDINAKVIGAPATYLKTRARKSKREREREYRAEFGKLSNRLRVTWQHKKMV